MDKKGNALIIGIVIVAIIAVALLFLAHSGYLEFNIAGDVNNGAVDDPLGSDYCGFTKGEIIGMFENLAGKNLNNDIGFSVVSALNVKACGSNSRQPEEIISAYKTQYENWYILSDTIGGGVGYSYNFVVWGNSPNALNSTLTRSVISADGITVNEWYNYNTITITGYGTRSGYLGFIAWLGS